MIQIGTIHILVLNIKSNFPKQTKLVIIYSKLEILGNILQAPL